MGADSKILSEVCFKFSGGKIKKTGIEMNADSHLILYKNNRSSVKPVNERAFIFK